MCRMQVFISYGNKSNDLLMQQYGFVETNNPEDVYVLANFLDQLKKRVRLDPQRLKYLEDGKYLEFVECLEVGREKPV